MRILLVEDDVMIGEAVVKGLSRASHAVDWLQDGEDARHAPEDVAYDCILLDLGLPGIDGSTLLSLWRREKVTTPVIILTARDGLSDRVAGLDGGADDYVVKPFELSELMARIRAVTRRQGGGSDSRLSNGVLTLDQATREVTVKNADGSLTPVTLTSREFALLEALLMRPGAVLSRESLENRIYSFDDEIESNAVEYIIHTLRKKVGAEQIKNVRGAGWKVQKAGFGAL